MPCREVELLDAIRLVLPPAPFVQRWTAGDAVEASYQALLDATAVPRQKRGGGRFGPRALKKAKLAEETLPLLKIAKGTLTESAAGEKAKLGGEAVLALCDFDAQGSLTESAAGEKAKLGGEAVLALCDLDAQGPLALCNFDAQGTLTESAAGGLAECCQHRGCQQELWAVFILAGVLRVCV